MNKSVLKILVFSSLYPNSMKQHHGIFVHTRLKHVLRHYAGKVSAVVIAPIAVACPVANSLVGTVVETECDSIKVYHPYFRTIRGIGSPFNPTWMYRAARPVCQDLIRQGFDFDLIDAHYFYPDGVAASQLSQEFGKPLVVTGRGSDLYVFAHKWYAKSRILETAHQAQQLITVSEGLQQQLLALGIAKHKVTVLRNGVDREVFFPVDRAAMQREWSIQASDFVLVSVGNLVEKKGHDLVIQAMAVLKHVRLWIIGTGPLKQRLQKLANKIGVAERVTFTGALKPSQVREFFSAADALVLASKDEGWPNVFLEALACGCALIAADTEGNRGALKTIGVGALVPRTVSGVVDGVRVVQQNRPDRKMLVATAKKFGWNEVAEGVFGVFEKALQASSMHNAF